MLLLRQAACLLWASIFKKDNRAKCVRRAATVLQQFGPTWIKAAQLLSLRSDLFSAEVCRELASVQDLGYGVPFESIRHLVKDELHYPLESLFEQFEEQPFLATSVAQLHRAYLCREKTWVVVKIQKPYAEQIFLQNMAVIRKILWLLNALSVYPNMRWDDFGKQLEELMTKELDFRYEASSLRRLKKKLRKHGIYVPETFKQYKARRVLVMEFIHGALMSDFIDIQRTDPARLQLWLQKNQIDPRRVARRLFHSVYRQIFEDNLFHGDMHPGNVVLLRHNRLAILDCRSIGSLEGELLAKYRLFLHALAHNRYSNAADTYFLVTSSLPAVDIALVKAELTRLWRVWEMKTHIQEFSYQEKSLGKVFDDMNKLMFRYQFAIQWSLSKLARTLVNLDASLQHLAPAMNYPRYMRRYFARADKRDAERQLRRGRKRIPRSMKVAQALPGQVAEYTLFQESIVRRQAQVIQGKTTKAGYVMSSFWGYVSLAVFMAELLGGCAFLYQKFHYPVQRIVGNQFFMLIRRLPELSWPAWLMILGGMLYLFIAIRRLKAQLDQSDVLLPDVHTAV